MSVTWLIFGILGVAVALVPHMIANRYKWYTQNELAEKFPEYENINLSFIGYFIALMIFAGLMLLLLKPFGNLDSEYAQIILPVWLVVVFSSLSITYGLFAARKGVYPVSKYHFGWTTYAYSEDDRVVRLGRTQVIASLVYLGFAVLITLIRLLVVVMGL